MNNQVKIYLRFFLEKTEIICFGLFFIIPFLSSSKELDRFYSTGWLYFTLFAIINFLINLKKHTSDKNKLLCLSLFIILFFQKIINKCDLDNLGIYILLIYGITIGIKFEIKTLKIKKYLRFYFLFIWLILFVFILLSLFKLFKQGYSHENTYQSIVYFSHRNILTEYFTVFTFFIISYLGFSKKNAILFQFIAFAVSLIFQSKAAIIGNLIGFIILEKRTLHFFIFIATVLVIFNLKNFKTFYYDKWDYFEKQKKFGFFEKNLDLIYLTCYSGSSYDRRNTWIWTAQNINFTGHGIGSWKYDFMGKIKLREVTPEVLHRRPHNDILLILYELGFLGVIILIILIKKIIDTKFYVILPILIIAFPLERAEFLMIITVALANLKNNET